MMRKTRQSISSAAVTPSHTYQIHGGLFRLFNGLNWKNVRYSYIVCACQKSAEPSQWPHRSRTRLSSLQLPLFVSQEGPRTQHAFMELVATVEGCVWPGIVKMHGTLRVFLEPQKHRQLKTWKHSISRVGESGSLCNGSGNLSSAQLHENLK